MKQSMTEKLGLANVRIKAQDRVDNETEYEYERETKLADMRIQAQQRHKQSIEKKTCTI